MIQRHRKLGIQAAVFCRLHCIYGYTRNRLDPYNLVNVSVHPSPRGTHSARCSSSLADCRMSPSSMSTNSCVCCSSSSSPPVSLRAHNPHDQVRKVLGTPGGWPEASLY